MLSIYAGSGLLYGQDMTGNKTSQIKGVTILPENE